MPEVSDCKVLAFLADSGHRKHPSFLPSIVPHVILFTCPMPFIALGAQVDAAGLQHTRHSCLFRMLKSIYVHDVSSCPALHVARQLQGGAAAPRWFHALTLLFKFSRPLTATAVRRQGSSSTSQAPQRITGSRTECRLLQSRIALYTVYRTLLGKCYFSSALRAMRFGLPQPQQA